MLQALEPRTLLHAGHNGLFINAGGGAFIDAGGHAWQADAYFSGGEVKDAIYDVSGTPDDAVFATRRFGASFNYAIPLAEPGTYRVSLMMSEPWFTARGQRVFSVSAEGAARIANFDLMTAAATKTAVRRWFDVPVTDGVLNLGFSGVVENAIVGGIVVERVARIPPPPTGLSASVESPTSVRLAWIDTSNEETGFAIERAGGGSAWSQVAVVNSNVTGYVNTGLTPGTSYQYRVRAISAAGASAASGEAPVSTPISSMPTPTRSPFGGTPIRLPGTLQAENFDDGPMGVAYNDQTPVNAGGAYRETAVDVYAIPATATGVAPQSTGRFAVGSLRPGEWLEYTVDVPRTGEFTARIHFATASAGGTATIALNGQSLWDPITLPTTGGWGVYVPVDLAARAIPAGRHLLRLTIVSSNRAGHDVGNIDWVQFNQVSVAQPPPEPPATGPAAPAALVATPAGATQVNLSWVDAANDEIGYRVERRVMGTSSWTRLTDLPTDATFFADTAAQPGTSYQYRVTARGAEATTPSVSAATKSATTPAVEGFRWQGTLANPVARYESAGAVVNGRLYVFGGFVNNLIQATARVDVFNPARQSWKRLGDMPEVVTHTGHAVDGPFIYIGGGFVGDHPGLGSRSVWRYDTRDDSWRRMPDLPAPRGAGAMAIVARELHFFGGLERSQFVTVNQAEHWVLDLTAPSLGWKKRAALPNPRNHLSAVGLNGKIYAIGGQDLWNEVSGAMAFVDVFDFTTNTWSSAAPLPIPRSHTSSSTFAFGGKIYVIGGATNDRLTLRDMTIYDPSTNRWTSGPRLLAPRMSPAAGVIGRQIIVSGGMAFGLNAQAETFVGLLD